jgi:hypothetical protein
MCFDPDLDDPCFETILPRIVCRTAICAVDVAQEDLQTPYSSCQFNYDHAAPCDAGIFCRTYWKKKPGVEHSPPLILEKSLAWFRTRWVTSENQQANHKIHFEPKPDPGLNTKVSLFTVFHSITYLSSI